ncbi:hypothetical protein HYFRA_00009677 [Hymenoscyphus fraxineus]|uniref:Mid2 domain-containing protein n=1 Tax=Hymenoscyphus fraxineus TaxID=746836 RepID=A0A9N9KS75_9HELO|nr:hypothetical protein HYFRA_00009677 [Hymenoscyphus fraxineus]
MRCGYLGLMAAFWVLSPVHGNQQDIPFDTPELFTTEVDSFNSIPSSTGSLNYLLNITARKIETTIPSSTLFLCQVTPNGQKPNITASRIGAWCVGEGDTCSSSSPDKEPTPFTTAIQAASTTGTNTVRNDVILSTTFSLLPGSTIQSYLFLCFTDSSGLCVSTSKAFQFPTQNVTLLDKSPADLVREEKFKPLDNPPSETNPAVVTLGATALPSATKLLTVSATSSQPAPSDTSSMQDPTTTPAPSSGLSTAAKAGIGVGALGVAAIILLGILLCLRKRQRQTKGPDQIMLNQSSADSHDLITEKEAERSSPASYEAPTQVYSGALNLPPKPQTPTRHSALSPYEEIPSQPYTGSAAAIPRRKPTISSNTNANPTNTNNPPPSIADPSSSSSSPPPPTTALSPTTTISPTISREVSAASTIGPPSRTDASPPTRTFEEYRDVPTTYAERHTPPAPFLGNESTSRGSMSEADLARLTEEEEERRIDAAIEEAERLRSGKGR